MLITVPAQSLTSNGQTLAIPAQSLSIEIFVASPAGTLITAGGTLVDKSGNQWSITSGGKVACQTPSQSAPVTDANTGGVIALYWDGTLIWQENTSKLWWSTSSAAEVWSPPNGTSVSPIPQPIIIVAPLPIATVGVPYSVTFTALNVSGTPVWTFTGLPSWLTPNGATISGEPTAATTAPTVITVAVASATSSASTEMSLGVVHAA